MSSSDVEAIDDLTAWARDELVELVGITSTSCEEHALVEHLERRCVDLGLPVRRMPVVGAADDLLIGWHARPSLLITAHLDTIRPMWDWSGEASIRDGRVYGLGAQDDKACIVAAIQGLVLARDAGVPVDELSVGIGLCVDEEIGGTGSIEMARALHPPFVVGLEGTELGLGTAEAGFVEVWCHLRGVGVHGALRELGENAIETAHTLIEQILTHPGAQHAHPLLGRNIPMVWEIRGGERLNVVPERCSFHLDWRVNPGGPSAASLLSWLEEATARAGGEVELVEVVEPFEIDPGAPVAAALGDAVASVTGVRPDPTGMVAWTDAHNFVDLAGSQTVVFGPGHLRNAHREDEWVEVSDVVTCARALAAMIEGCPGWLPMEGP
ncbi:MAG TPA: M20/M25/M40 family metallo-hydrolase [Actinomycetota bacterium]